MNTHEKIIILMHGLGWRQKDLVNNSGVSQGEISKILSGSIQPNDEVKEKIAKALKTTNEKLLPDIISNEIKVHKPMTDEEVILIRAYNKLKDLKTSDEHFEVFKALADLMKKEVDRKNNYIELLKSADFCKMNLILMASSVLVLMQ